MDKLEKDFSNRGTGHGPGGRSLERAADIRMRASRLPFAHSLLGRAGGCPIASLATKLEDALGAPAAPADIQQIADALESYRRGVRNK